MLLTYERNQIEEKTYGLRPKQDPIRYQRIIARHTSKLMNRDSHTRRADSKTETVAHPSVGCVNKRRGDPNVP